MSKIDLGLLDRTFFRTGRSDTEAGVVHQHVDATLQSNHFRDRGFDGFVAGHIEGQHLKRSLARLRSPSAGAVDLVAGRREPLRRGFSDA